MTRTNRYEYRREDGFKYGVDDGPSCRDRFFSALQISHCLLVIYLKYRCKALARLFPLLTLSNRQTTPKASVSNSSIDTAVRL